MEEELYINDKLIQLPLQSVSQTLQVNDIGEVKDRNANYTNNIKIPKTEKNIESLELLSVSGSISDLPYSSVKVKYIRDGIEMISDGKGLLKNTNDYYNLIVYDGNIVLSELVGKTALNDLDFSSENHNLTESLYLGSFTNTSDYIYTLNAFYDGFSLGGFPSPPFSIDITTPMFYAHSLFSKIFTSRGYSIEGAIFTDPLWLERVISVNNGYNRTATNTEINVYYKSTVLDPPIVYSVAYTEPATPQTYTKGSYIATSTGSFNVKLTGSISVVFGINYSLVIRINNVVRKRLYFTNNQGFNFDENFNVDSGDEIDVDIDITPQEYAEFNKVQLTTAFNINICSNSWSIPIVFEDLIGDTLQIDFIKSMMQHFGLIFRKKKNENVFEFIQMKELLIDRSGADDWSDKYVGVSNEEYKPPYARRNFARFKYDDIGQSNIVQTYADGLFFIENDRLQEEKTLFTSIFKAGVEDSNFYRMKHWTNKDGIITINSDGLRIYKITQVNDSIKYRFKYESESWSNYTGTVAKTLFLDYQNDINNCYLEFREMIQSFKSTIINVNLTVLDVYQLDFFKLKYFKQLGAYYYLNKVISFKKNYITRIEAIRLGADIVAGINAGQSSYSGSSDYSGSTLNKNTFGSMVGLYSGASDYSGSTLRGSVKTAFQISVLNDSTGLGVCGEGTFTTNWHNGSSPLPEVNDTVFTDSGGTTPKNGGDNYWKTQKSGVGYWLKINASGVVTAKGLC